MRKNYFSDKIKNLCRTNVQRNKITEEDKKEIYDWLENLNSKQLLEAEKIYEKFDSNQKVKLLLEYVKSLSKTKPVAVQSVQPKIAIKKPISSSLPTAPSNSVSPKIKNNNVVKRAVVEVKTNSNIQKCEICGVFKPIDFFKEDGKILKICSPCREIAKKHHILIEPDIYERLKNICDRQKITPDELIDTIIVSMVNSIENDGGHLKKVFINIDFSND